MTKSRLSISFVQVVTVLATLWLVVALPFVTDTGCNFLIAMALGACWLLLALVWLAVPLFRPRRGFGWWLLAAAIGCTGPILAISGIGLIGRVALCESALVDYASKVEPGNKDFMQAPRWVGLFRVDGEENFGGVVLLYTSESFINRTGLAYVPLGTAAPGDLPRRRLQHLHGPWYWFYWKF